MREFRDKHVMVRVKYSCLPPNTGRPISLKWVFTYKYDEHGDVIGHKARLVARGFTQVPERDYDETFSPVVRRSTTRLFFQLAAQLHFNISQYDVKSAYLNADLDIPQYCEQPPGFEDGTNKICRIDKALYGLKQAGRQWNIHLTNTLKAAGYLQSKYDPCLFFRVENGELLSLAVVWVDDILQAHRNEAAHQHFFKALEKAYQVKESSTASWILGMRLQQSAQQISIDQAQHTKTFLQASGMSEARPMSTPAVPAAVLKRERKHKEEESSITVFQSEFQQLDKKMTKEYQQVVGSLLYIADCTRPDISYAVGRLCRHMSCPTAQDMTAAKRVARYLCKYSDLPLNYKKPTEASNEVQLAAYTDASWADDRETGRTTYGYLVFINGSLVSWKSKLLRPVALSTCEAEYMSLSEVTREVMWITNLCEELLFKVKKPVTAFCDNEAAIMLAKNPVNHDRTKHINTYYHFVRQTMVDGLIEPSQVGTSQQLADGLTKGLPVDLHMKFLHGLFKTNLEKSEGKELEEKAAVKSSKT